jgi:hypothetical protein
MTTKNEMINLLKKEFPTLQLGDDQKGYTQLSPEQYEEQINLWADARLAKEAEEAKIQAKAQAKAELLERLGISFDEAKLLTA